MASLPTAQLDGLLRSLVDRAYEFERVELTDGEPAALFPSLPGDSLDALLRDAQHEGLVDGRRLDYSAKRVWSHLRLTVRGLRWIGEWPPPGLEHQPGPWEAGYFGTIAKPVLASLRDAPPRHEIEMAPFWGREEERWTRWRALQLLLEAGLISGRVTDDSLNDVRITAAGRDALDPSDRDPLDTATRKLLTGAKIEAIIIAVEKGVGPRLKDLAAQAGIPLKRDDGRPLRLSETNNRLKSEGVITETERTIVEGMLKRRNDCGHGHDEQVSYKQAQAVIAEAQLFLEEHPAP